MSALRGLHLQQLLDFIGRMQMSRDGPRASGLETRRPRNSLPLAELMPAA
jgi:hypothetical protein